MTGLEFRTTHGDPTGWTTADFETFEHIVETDALPDFTIYTLLPTPAPQTAPAA